MTSVSPGGGSGLSVGRCATDGELAKLNGIDQVAGRANVSSCPGIADIVEVLCDAVVVGIVDCGVLDCAVPCWPFLSPAARIRLCCGKLVWTAVTGMLDLPFLLWVALFFCPLAFGVPTSAILVTVPAFPLFRNQCRYFVASPANAPFIARYPSSVCNST